MGKILGIKYVVVREYGEGVGGVACAEFREQADAREYFLWKQKQWKAEEKKYPGQNFVWKLYRRTDYYPGEHPSGCEWMLLEG
jgi:hypothetical protein